MTSKVNRRVLPIVIAMSIMVSFWGGGGAVRAETGKSIAEKVSALSDLSGHWAEDTMLRWASNGLLTGDGAGRYRPNDEISRAEFAALIDRVLNLPQQGADAYAFSDVESGAWYASAVASGYAAGIVQGTDKGKFNPTTAITRQDAAVIVARAFGLEDEVAADAGFSDKMQISPYASESVAALQSRKYISGRSGNRFAPQERITRAEVVQMIDNAMGELVWTPGTYERDFTGNVVVNTAGIELKNLMIAGDLYIAQGVGEGDVLLNNVTVKGKTYVFGGGIDSVKLKDSRLLGTLIVNKRSGPVRILVSGATAIARVVMQSGGILEEGELTREQIGFRNVEINIRESAKSRVVTLSGQFEQVRQIGVTVKVELKQGTVVETFAFDAIAAVTGAGTIRLANIRVSGSNLSKWPDKVNFGIQVTATIEAKLVDREQTGGNTSGSGTTSPTNPNLNSSPSPSPSPSPSQSPQPSPEPDTELTIVHEGSAEAAVVVSGTADDQTLAAASKLIGYIRKSTGVELSLLADRLNSDRVTAENGTIGIEFAETPLVQPASTDFKVQTIIDGIASINEQPANVSWDENTKTATLTVTRVEKSTVQQSLKYQIRYKGGEPFSGRTILIPANPRGSLLKNGSFEAGYTGYANAKPWEYWNGGFEAPSSLVARSAEQARTGAYSLKLSGTSLVWPNQSAALTGYGQYEYTAYLYKPQGMTTNGTVQMFVNFFANDGTELQKNTGPITPATVSNGDWVQMTWTLNVPEQANGKQVTKVLAGFEGANFAAGETVYIDDAALIKTDAVDQDAPVTGSEDETLQDLPETYEGVQIYLGKKGLTEQEQAQLLDGTVEDGFVIHQNGRRITIAGPTAWGTEFGVDEFLERYVGVRWLMPGEDWEDVPQAASLVVPVGDEVQQEPAFFSRAFEEQLVELPVRAEWAQNLRMHDTIKFTHNLFQMFPVAQYPQFYRPGTIDKRWETEHPCLQANGIVDEAVRIINDYFAANPDATSYSLGMNDTTEWCEADSSDPAAKLNSIGMVDMSDIYFDWVDKVSEGVFAVHPDKYLGAYAYFNVYDPPVHVQLDPRVVVYITDERVSWGDPDMKSQAQALSEAWAQVGATVAFYDYVYGSPYVLPRTPFQLLADEYRYAASIGVGAYYSELYANFGEGPKPYLSAKLQWDPQQDAVALLDDWYERAVGPEAAPDLKAYYANWQRFWEQDIYDTEWYSSWKNLSVRTNFMPLNSPDYLRDVSLAEIAVSRQLLESVVAKAQTQQQKKRANDLLRMFGYYELSKMSYTDMIAEVAVPTNDAEAADILDNILDRNAKMDQRKALFADLQTHELYFQYRGALNWGGVSSKEIKALSSWIADHPDSEMVERMEQLSVTSPFSAVRNAVKLILLSRDGTTVKNPGFETGMAEWFSFSDTIAELTNEANSGNQAVRVQASSVEQDVFVESGKTYKLVFYGKASGGANANLVGMNFWDVPGVGLTGAHVTVNSDQYRKYSVTFTPPEGFSHVTIVIYKPAGAGWVYADDFVLTELSADDPPLIAVTGENGTVQAVFDDSPDAVPAAADFTIQAIVDGEEATVEQPIAISWNDAAHTATLTVQSVTPAHMAQTVQYRVTYKGENTLLSPEIPIAADAQASALRNSSFEIGYGSEVHARPWEYGCGGNQACVTARSSEQARSGQISLKLSGATWAIWPSQSVSLTGYGDYEFTAYLYKPQGLTTNGTIQMFVIPQSADGANLQSVYAGPIISATVSDGDWHEMKWTVPIPEQINGTPVAKAMVGFEVMNFGTGETIYLDDVTWVRK